MVYRIKSITPPQRRFMAQKWRLELFFHLPFKIISPLKQMHKYKTVSLARNSENKLYIQSVQSCYCKKCMSILSSVYHVSILLALWKKNNPCEQGWWFPSLDLRKLMASLFVWVFLHGTYYCFLICFQTIVQEEDTQPLTGLLL